MNTFLPTNYEVPKSSGHYMRLDIGDNVFRILGSAIMGWEDWTDDRKPIRVPYTEKKPLPINPKKAVKHFWAFPVWDYKDKQVKILEITQSTIQDAILTFSRDEAWGNPMSYDINITKIGSDLDTKYNVIARPPKQLHPEISRIYSETSINLNALFSGDDPFEKKDVTFQDKVQEYSPFIDTDHAAAQASEPTINVDAIPF